MCQKIIMISPLPLSKWDKGERVRVWTGEKGLLGSANGCSRENTELRGIMRIFDRTMFPPPPPWNGGIKISHTRCSVYIWPGQGHHKYHTCTAYFLYRNQSQVLNSQHEKWHFMHASASVHISVYLQLTLYQSHVVKREDGEAEMLEAGRRGAWH